MTSCRRRWSATLSGSLVFFLPLVAVCVVSFVFLSRATGVVCYFKYLIIVSSFPLPLAYSFKENSTWHRHDLFEENKKKKKNNNQEKVKAAAKLHLELLMSWRWRWRRCDELSWVEAKDEIIVDRHLFFSSLLRTRDWRVRGGSCKVADQRWQIATWLIQRLKMANWRCLRRLKHPENK